MIHVLGFGAGIYILNHILNPDQHRGEQGLLGHRGEQGLLGCRGEQGIRGERGVRGERGEKGEPGEFLECTSQNQMIDRLDDKLSRHIRNAPSVVREVLSNKTTEETVMSKIGKGEEEIAASREVRRLKNLLKHPLSKYYYWYSNCGGESSGGNLLHKHKADATYGPHPDVIPEGWTVDSNKARAESVKIRMAAAERSFAAEELERKKLSNIRLRKKLKKYLKEKTTVLEEVINNKIRPARIRPPPNRERGVLHGT